MSCPYRHREVSAQHLIDMDIVEACKREVKVKEDLDHYER